MEIFFEIGFSEDEVLDIKQYINNLSKEEILFKVYILKRLGCLDRHIKNIILTNPIYLIRSNDDILKLIKKLEDLKFKSIYILLDSNPNILNRDVYEIDEYINNKLNSGIVLEYIVDYLDNNPYIFDEM